MADHVLETHDLAIHYGGVKAVDGVSLSLDRGMIRGLIGPNGAGKSTVIDAVTGRRRPIRGKVMLDGKDVTALGVTERRKLGLSRSFQRTSAFGRMTVRKQVELASYMIGTPNPGADADEVLHELSLSDRSDTLGDELGYGERRRLDLALALAGQPSALLLDEPMAGLSVTESLDLAQHLKMLTSRRKVSVLLVEHDMEVVFAACDVITVLELGRVIAQGPPRDIRSDPRVRKAYLGSAA